VRTFEEISEVFQDAHLSKVVRIFEGGAHLRTRAPALDLVPLVRKVAHALASASTFWVRIEFF
jgi:hypothetical protein